MNKIVNRLMKYVCLLLALMMVATMFVACNSGKEDDTVTSGAVLNEGEKDPVPHYDWSGRPFRILGVHNEYEPNFEIVGEASGDEIESSVFLRNNWISEYYNVEISDVGINVSNPLDAIKKSLASGDKDYDLVFLIRNDMSTAVMSDYMRNLLVLPYLNYDNEWYNPLTIESMKIGDRLYHMTSDFSLVDKARTNMLYFNRDMATDNQLPDIIQLVRDGKWTIEEMLKCAKVINDSGDLNGNDIKELSDRWGMTCGGKEAAAAFWSAMNNRVVSVSKDGNWSIDIANEHSEMSIQKIQPLFHEDMSFNGSRFNDWDAPFDTFIAERALFMSATLGGIVSLGANAKFSYTVIPYPKYDVGQSRYYTTNDNTYCATFGIPKCTPDVEFSAFMIEVLSWKSSTTTYPTYYESVCKLRKSYDKICSEMLDFVLDGLVFDFGLIYSNHINLKTKVLLGSIYSTDSIVTLYEGEKTTAEGKVERLFDAVKYFS